MIGSPLPGIGYSLAGLPRGQEIDGERAAAGAQRAGRGGMLLNLAMSGQEGLVSTDIEAVVAFKAVGIGVDPRKVVPDAKQVTVSESIDRIENTAVGAVSGLLEMVVRVGLQAAEEHILVARGGDAA